jgi:hypothetical protein
VLLRVLQIIGHIGLNVTALLAFFFSFRDGLNECETQTHEWEGIFTDNLEKLEKEKREDRVEPNGGDGNEAESQSCRHGDRGDEELPG